jgi:hypothetical protein
MTPMPNEGIIGPSRRLPPRIRKRRAPITPVKRSPGRYKIPSIPTIRRRKPKRIPVIHN